MTTSQTSSQNPKICSNLRHEARTETAELLRAARGEMMSVDRLDVNVAVFLTGDEAAYVTGANVVVDSGWPVVLPGGER